MFSLRVKFNIRLKFDLLHKDTCKFFCIFTMVTYVLIIYNKTGSGSCLATLCLVFLLCFFVSVFVRWSIFAEVQKGS